MEKNIQDSIPDAQRPEENRNEGRLGVDQETDLALAHSFRVHWCTNARNSQENGMVQKTGRQGNNPPSERLCPYSP
jgi:hypothetical protein